MHKKLFIPGPVEVRDDVLQKMATPMIGHRTKDASKLQREISELAMKLFYTNNQILLSTTSGSGFDGRGGSFLHQKARGCVFDWRIWRSLVSNGAEQ